MAERLKFGYEVNGSIVACTVFMRNKKSSAMLVTSYLPPSNSKYAFTSKDLQNLFIFIKKAKTKVDEIIMCGDFIFRTKNWNTLSSCRPIETEFLKLMEQINQEHKIDFFTASTGILDLILVSNGIQALDISKPNVEPEFSNLSNHYPIKTKLCVETKCLLKRTFCPEVVYSYCKGDYPKLAETLIIYKFEPYC